MKKLIYSASKALMPDRLRKAVLHYAYNIAPEHFAEFAYRHAFAPDMARALKDAAGRGLRPDVIVDVGAFEGGWARLAKDIWPHARLIMVEGNEEKRPILAPVAEELGADLRFALLGAEEGEEVEFYVMESGSSVFQESSSYDRRKETRRLRRLDMLLSDAPAIDFLKIDTQGYELEVMKGASRLLSTAKAVLLEVSLIEINEGAPLIHDVLPFMKERGFVSYEIVEIHRRQLDRAMNQIDVLFLREDSPLIADKSFT